MAGKPDTGALTDLIYGALHGRASWLDFLEQARTLVPNGQALLFFHDANSGAGAFPLQAGGDPALAEAYRTHYSTVNPWMPHAAIRPLGRVVRSDEMLPRERLIKTEFYDGFLKPQGVESGFGVTIRREQGCNFLFSVVGADLDEKDAETVKQALQEVVPHLREAFDYYRRHPEDSGPGLAWGEAARPPGARGIVRLGVDRRVLFADRDAVRLTEGTGVVSVGTFGRFACAHEPLLEYVDAQLASWDGGASPPAVRTFHVPRAPGALPLRIRVYRPGGTGLALFRGPECVLHIEDPVDGLAAAVDEFAELYRLSPAEHRIVMGLAHGLTLKAVAEEVGVSPETTRVHLKAIFAKSGLNRQTELIRHVSIMAAHH